MKSQYDVDRIQFGDLNSNVVLPTYQRQLVWSDQQKESFIDNISKGYPFGSILLYRYEGTNKLSLIDGLQRFSTLRDYKAQPGRYFKNLEPYVEKVFTEIEEGTGCALSDDKKSELAPQIESLLRKCLTLEKPNSRFLRDAIKAQIDLYPPHEKHQDALLDLQDALTEEANDYLNLDDLVIPCIIFNGDEADLPDVFANLNQGGTKLSKYQVLAAHWSKHDFALPCSERGTELLKNVIKRYSRLQEDRDLLIEGFDPDQMRQTRTINLSEFCFALGELITRTVPVFWQSASKSGNERSEDTFNVVGYLSTAIALGVDNRALSKLPECINLFQSEDFLEQLIDCIIEEYEVIQGEFERWLLRPGSKKTYESGAITDMQALSFFAALWHKRYAVDAEAQELKTIENYKANGYEATRKNLIAHCLSDIAIKAWQGSGDSRLANYYVKTADSLHSYASPVSADILSKRLASWYEEVAQRGSINIEKFSKMLLCVHTTPNRASKYSADKYDIEHVISKRKLDDLYASGQIPGGLLGNLMFLNIKTNRGKKQFNLYSLQEDHEGVKFEYGYLKMLNYPTREEIFDAEDSLANGNASKARELMNRRASKMIDVIAKEVCNQFQ